MLQKIKILLATIMLFSLNNMLRGSETKEYAISNIAPSLTENAMIVIRKNLLKVTIEKDGVTEEHTEIISILNKNGLNYAVFEKAYSSYSSISGFKMILYDENGNKSKTYSMTDLIDMSAYDGFSLYTDARIKLFDPPFKKYPCTVEFQYKIKLKSSLMLQPWLVYPNYDCSVEHSSLLLNISNSVKLNYLEKNMPVSAQITDIKGYRQISWNVENLKAIQQEDFEEPFIDFTPVVYLSPEKFEIDNTQGDLTSWSNFGKWYLSLIKDRDALSPETTEKIQVLTKGLDTLAKIRKVYKYMQKKTRYVSIQIGIGGWQPFDAKTVDRLGYGDCKALANYTSVLLKAAGIKSHQVLIKAGGIASPLKSSFVCNEFNHVILAVPTQTDTVYLECTDSNLPAGHLGSFTDNRKALMMGDSAGILINTRNYTKDENRVESKINVRLSETGTSPATLSTTYSGINFDDIQYLSLKTNDDITKKLYEKIEIPNYTISNYSYIQPDSAQPVITENVDLAVNNYLISIGNSVLLNLNINNRLTELPKISENRKSHFVIKRHNTWIDTVVYTIPKNIVIKVLPETKVIGSDFGSYSSKVFMQGNELYYIRTLSLSPCNYPPAEAQKFITFFSAISKADNVKATLFKN